MVRKYLILWIILLFGLVTRVYKMTDLPLYGDELTMVYDTYSLLKTGKDSTGEVLPLTFNMGAGRPAGYVYLSIPFVALFGPSELGVRLLSVFSGIGTIFVVYLLATKIFSKKVGLISSFLVAVSPLAISLSRGGFEANFATFLATLGTYFFITAKTKKYFYFLWAIAWGITIHTYPTFKFVLPFFLISIFIFILNLKSVIKNKFFLISVLVLGLFVALSINETVNGKSEERFLSINIFADQAQAGKIIEKVNYERSISTAPEFVTKYFYNKPLEYGKLLIQNYFKNFSPEYLLTSGDGNPRHNPAETGILYLIEIVTILIGLVSLLTNKRKIGLFLIFWILIVPVATALVTEPHNLRNAFLLVPFALLSGYGISLLNKKTSLIVLVLIFLQLIFILQRIYFLSPQKFSSFWAESAKLASIVAIEKSKTYDTVILSDKIDNVEFGYPVYSLVEPNEVISQNIRRTDFYGGEFKKFENVLIGQTSADFIARTTNLLKGNSVYIGNITEAKDFSNFETIKSSNTTGGIIIKVFE